MLLKLEFPRQIFKKNTQRTNSIKIRPVGDELLHADGRTDMMQLIVTFRNFANAPKNQSAKCVSDSIIINTASFLTPVS